MAAVPGDWAGLDTETRMRLLLATMEVLREDMADLKTQLARTTAWMIGVVVALLLLIIGGLVTALLAVR